MPTYSTAFITERYMHVADDQLRAAAQAMSGPERIGQQGAPGAAGGPEDPNRHRDSIPPALDSDSAGVAPTVASDPRAEAGISQVVERQVRRGAGVAEQGCLPSSYPG